MSDEANFDLSFDFDEAIEAKSFAGKSTMGTWECVYFFV